MNQSISSHQYMEIIIITRQTDILCSIGHISCTVFDRNNVVDLCQPCYSSRGDRNICLRSIIIKNDRKLCTGCYLCKIIIKLFLCLRYKHRCQNRDCIYSNLFTDFYKADYTSCCNMVCSAIYRNTSSCFVLYCFQYLTVCVIVKRIKLAGCSKRKQTVHSIIYQMIYHLSQNRIVDFTLVSKRSDNRGNNTSWHKSHFWYLLRLKAINYFSFSTETLDIFS